jgi:hypothetical protein
MLANAVNGLARRWNKKPMPPAVLNAVDVALSEARDQIQGNARLGQPVLNASSDIAGSFLWHSQVVVEGRSLSDGAGDGTVAGRAEYATVSGSAGSLLELCGQVSEPRVTFPPRKFAEVLGAGDQKRDADFVLGVTGYLDTLQKPPFRLNAARFK